MTSLLRNRDSFNCTPVVLLLRLPAPVLAHSSKVSYLSNTFLLRLLQDKPRHNRLMWPPVVLVAVVVCRELAQAQGLFYRAEQSKRETQDGPSSPTSTGPVDLITAPAAAAGPVAQQAKTKTKANTKAKPTEPEPEPGPAADHNCSRNKPNSPPLPVPPPLRVGPGLSRCPKVSSSSSI